MSTGLRVHSRPADWSAPTGWATQGRMVKGSPKAMISRRGSISLAAFPAKIGSVTPVSASERLTTQPPAND